MLAIITRELIVTLRRPAFVVAMCVHVALLAAFVLVWHRGLPVAQSSLDAQARSVEYVLLGLCLPWAAIRCMASDRGDSFTMMCAVTARRPSSVVTAKAIGLACALGLIVLAAVPVTLVSQEVSAVPAVRATSNVIAFLGVAVMTTGIAIAWALAAHERMVAWVGATLCTCAALGIVTTMGQSGAAWILTLIGIVSTLATAAWSESAARYVRE